jgi:histidinol-phosphate aminotransferase
VKKLIRDNVSKIQQYEPGKPVEVLQMGFSLKQEFLQMASNENPLGPSPLAVEAIRKSLQEAHLYPDNSCYSLKEKLSEHLDVSPQNFRIGNGTTELILLLGMVLLNPEDSLVMSQSSFVMAKIVAQIMDCRLVEIPLREYHHDLDAILDAIREETKIIYIDNPMNPIGTMVTHQEMMKFLKRIPEDVVLVLDEAYHDYVNHSDYPKSIPFVREGKNIVVLRTFSKMYGLAGLRVGYCVAQQELIQAMNNVSPPFSVNRMGQIAAAAALEDSDHVKRTKEINEQGKVFLYQQFEELGIFYIPSVTNFVTVDTKTAAREMARTLQNRGIIVRPLTMYGQPTFLRVTIGTPEQNRRFIKELKTIYM